MLTKSGDCSSIIETRGFLKQGAGLPTHEAQRHKQTNPGETCHCPLLQSNGIEPALLWVTPSTVIIWFEEVSGERLSRKELTQSLGTCPNPNSAMEEPEYRRPAVLKSKKYHARLSIAATEFATFVFDWQNSRTSTSDSQDCSYGITFNRLRYFLRDGPVIRLPKRKP